MRRTLRSARTGILTLVAAWAGGGCGPTTYDVLREIVLVGTARDVWGNVVGLAGATAAPADPTCPVVTVMGTTTTYAGGCTDSEGSEWSGTATIDGDVAGDFTATWVGYTQVSDGECSGTPVRATRVADGALTVAGTTTGTTTFTADLRWTTRWDDPACLPGVDDRWDYLGTRIDGPDADGDGTPDSYTFDGAGTVSRVVRGDPYDASAGTSDQLVDRAACDQEPLSGTSTFMLDGHTGVLVNDGATDCDDPPTGSWTFDDRDRGEIPIGGVCSVARVGVRAGAPRGAAALLLATAVMLVARRRRRPSLPARPR